MTPNSKYEILIADDERSITVGLSELLELEGYRTATVNDGEKALSLLEEKAFDVALLDLVMPGLDGLQILTEIKKRGLSTTIIMISGKGSTEATVKAIKSGAYDYLDKPVDPNRLRTIIAKAVSLRYHGWTRRKSPRSLSSDRCSGGHVGECIDYR